MRKPMAVLLLLGLIFSISAPAQAANKMATLTKAFQKYLVDGESAYTQAMTNAKNLYEPQILATQSSLLTAQAQYLTVNQVTILKNSVQGQQANALAYDALNCPATHLDCYDQIYKNRTFRAGEVTTTFDFLNGKDSFANESNGSQNLGILQSIDLQVQAGNLALNNASGFIVVENTIRTQYQYLLTLNRQYNSARASATADRDYVLSFRTAIESAILSAKRADSNSSVFDKAFVVSLKFEYNAKRLNELAREPWYYITSLKALSDAVSVTKSSIQADNVSSHYSYSAAANINSIYGNLFLNESAFKSSFKIISNIYKLTTGVSLSLK
jgi:hypothetical protein